jgi:hypothetical protein
MKHLLACLVLLLSLSMLRASNADADSSLPLPKHFIKPIVFTNYFSTPYRGIENKPGQGIRISDIAMGGVFPIATQVKWSDDYTRMKSTHLLLSASVSGSRMDAPYTQQPVWLRRPVFGARLIYNDGLKSTWFFSVSPFAATDGSRQRAGRFSSMLVYNKTINENLSLRLGYWRTYAFGQRRNLPILGVRLGKLDDLHISIQFPRSIQVNYPMNHHFGISVFRKPQGSLYTLKNTDAEFGEKGEFVFLARREFLTGVQMNYNPFNNLSLQAAFGIASGTFVRSTELNASRFFQNNSAFSNDRAKPAPFIQAGLVLSFGKSKSIGGNVQLYEVIDFHTQFGNDDNQSLQNNQQIQQLKRTSEKTNLRFSDIQDLISESDF